MSAKRSPVARLIPRKRSSRDVSVGRGIALADFSDAESQRVLSAAARAVARELGRQAAREYFAELIGKPKVS